MEELNSVDYLPDSISVTEGRSTELDLRNNSSLEKRTKIDFDSVPIHLRK